MDPMPFGMGSCILQQKCIYQINRKYNKKRGQVIALLYKKSFYKLIFHEGIRTPDLGLLKAVLYPLSYMHIKM